MNYAPSFYWQSLMSYDNIADGCKYGCAAVKAGNRERYCAEVWHGDGI